MTRTWRGKYEAHLYEADNKTMRWCPCEVVCVRMEGGPDSHALAVDALIWGEKRQPFIFAPSRVRGVDEKSQQRLAATLAKLRLSWGEDPL